MKKIFILLFLVVSFFLCHKVDALTYSKVNETPLEVSVSSWTELYSTITKDTYSLIGDTLNRNILIITLTGNNWKATKSIKIESWQHVILLPEGSNELVITRSASYDDYLIINSGILDIGSENMSGTIIFDGNRNNITAVKALLQVAGGTLDIYKNIIIRNNNVASNAAGGGINIDYGDVNIFGATIDNNSANYGGGIYIANYQTPANLYMKDVTISNNTSNNSGGGMYVYGNVTIDGEDTKIINNNANTYGGGFIVKGNTTMNAGLIKNNRAINNGGGGVRVDGKFVFNGGSITNNTANEDGGGVNFTGRFLFNGGGVSSNSSGNGSNNIYPNMNYNIDWTTQTSLKLKSIKPELVKSTTLGTAATSTPYMQGGTLTDKYLVYVQVADDSSNAIINILDKDTYEVLNTVNSYVLGHANDMTYNSKTGYIYVTGFNSSKIYRFKINNYYEVTDYGYITLDQQYRSIAYNRNDDTYILMDYDQTRIYTFDSNFNKISSFPVSLISVEQSIAYFNGYMYVICYEYGLPTVYSDYYNNREQYSNIVYQFDLNGNIVQTLYVSNELIYGEIENISLYNNGDILLGYMETINGNYVANYYKRRSLYGDYINVSDYLLNNSKNVIYGINTATSVTNFINKIDANGTFGIYNNNTLVNDTDTIKTGYILKVSSTNKEYKLSVIGDVLGTGEVTMDSYKTISRHIISGNVLTQEEYLLAADYNRDGLVKMNDVMLLMRNKNT